MREGFTLKAMISGGRYRYAPSTMLAADASLTSIATGNSARLAFGWRLNDWFYLGREAQAFACDGYRQLRLGAVLGRKWYQLGAHVTALKTGLWEWSAAARWSDDTDGRTGPYLRLGVLTRR